MEWFSGLSLIICNVDLGLSVLCRVEKGSNSEAVSSRLSDVESLVSSADYRLKGQKKIKKQGVDLMCRVSWEQLSPGRNRRPPGSGTWELL